MGRALECLRNRKVTDMATVQWARAKVGGDGSEVAREGRACRALFTTVRCVGFSKSEKMMRSELCF